jgi:hypothetical protein
MFYFKLHGVSNSNIQIEKTTNKKLDKYDEILSTSEEFNLFVNHLKSSNIQVNNQIMNNMNMQHYVETRIKYYLGEMYSMNTVYPKDDYINVDILLNDMDNTRRIYPKGIFEHGIYSSMVCKLTTRGLIALNSGVSGYTKRLLPYLEAYNLKDMYLLYLIGDVEKQIDDYYLSKIRLEGCNKSVIIKAANLHRHWGVLYSKEMFDNDIPFQNKVGCALWRGATTGQVGRCANRFDLVEKYFDNHNKINIGFSNIAWGTVDTSGNIINYHSYAKWVKGKMSIKEQLRYKYLLAVDGNDKASGLNWQLASKSLVMMAKPTKISWLMEDNLIPNVHYIQLKNDFSDLEEKIEWCESHPNECQQMVNNANHFMSQFYNENMERYIESQVIVRYMKKIQLSKVRFT